MPTGLFRELPPGLSGWVAAEQMADRRGANALNQAQGIFGLQQAMEAAPIQNEMRRLQLENMRNPAPAQIDLGGEIVLVDPRTKTELGRIKKVATPDALLREQGATERHQIPSGSSALGAQASMRGQDIGAQTARRGQDITLRGQDLQEGRERFGPPQEVTGPSGQPILIMQNRKTGQMMDPNTQQPVQNIGPKLGEVAQKQKTGVTNTKDAITQYREALKRWSATDIVDPNARAKIGTIYNNMLLQAKEAYNLGVLNGPDYMILQQVITNPASLVGAITSNKALDAQAAKLDEIMDRIGAQVTATQSGQPIVPPGTQMPQRRSTDTSRILEEADRIIGR